MLITDARCYSATDIFAAGFLDHSVGKILGVDDNTGAGGANVWTLDQIRGHYTDADALSPLSALPAGAGMRVAIRRALRVGAEAGTEIEDLGITPDALHRVSRSDVLTGNPDLLDRALAMRAAQQNRAFTFDLTATPAGSEVTCEPTTRGVDYVDVFINRGASGTYDVHGDALTFRVDAPQGSLIDLRGCRGTGEVLCTRRWTRM